MSNAAYATHLERTKSKSDLAVEVARQEKANERKKKNEVRLREQIADRSAIAHRLSGAILTAPASAGIVGAIEGKFPAVRGWVPAIVGGLAALGGLAKGSLGTQLSYVGAANLGVVSNRFWMEPAGKRRRRSTVSGLALEGDTYDEFDDDDDEFDEFEDEVGSMPEDEWDDDERELLGV